ncbi:MFS transporter [Halomonas sp. HP20-15]|uniref:MFS transporter n=1 Tax=Halomonas sp. HP20-15 TaxID=3085901 RepID=UPI00298148C9|nr:MFS transporter [Halomonas sp. HP20-15]MDW5376232.1 MFS transporter [Halomonas sp. HP20-15]
MSEQIMTSNGDTRRSAEAPLTFAVLASVQAALIFTIALIMIPLPQIADEFALTPAQVLLLQVAYGLSFSGLLLFGGRLTDRYGARAMLATGLAVFGLASLVAPLTARFDVLIAMRFLQGVGGAITAPAALGVVRALFPSVAAFARAMAVWGGVSVLGAVLGFISSGIISSFVSWRWIFVVPITVSLLGLAATASLLPASQVVERARRPGLDPAGALLATTGIVLASYGLIASHEASWASFNVLVPLATGVVLCIAFLILERRARHPLLPPVFLLDSARLTGLAGMLLAAAGSLLIEFILLIYLQEVRGWTALETAVSFLPFAVALFGSNFLTAPIVGRFGARATTVAGLLVGGVGLAWLATLGHETVYLTTLMPGQMLLAVGMALTFAGSAVLVTANVPEPQMGLAGGVMNTAMELGPTVGFTLLMAVAATRADTVEGYAWAFGTAAAIYVIAAMLGLAVRQPCARRSDSEL